LGLIDHSIFVEKGRLRLLCLLNAPFYFHIICVTLC